MKKILTIVLSLVLILSSNCVIFAEDDPTMGSWDGTNYTADSTNNSATGAKGNEFDVTATVTKDDGTKDDTPVYCVDIAWSMTPAEYTSGGDSYVWSPKDLKYVRDSNNTNGTLTPVTGKDSAAVSISVTNKSNADVKYEITYTSKKQEQVNISTATQTSTNKEKGTLTSAASGVTPTLTNSPDDTVATGTATKETYTATIALDKTSGENPTYVASQTTAGSLTLGTYTINVKVPGKNVTVNFTCGHQGSGYVGYFEFDPGDTALTALKITDQNTYDNCAEKLEVSKKYLVIMATGECISSGNNPSVSNLSNVKQLTDTEISEVSNLKNAIDNNGHELSFEKVFEILDDNASLDYYVNFSD